LSPHERCIVKRRNGVEKASDGMKRQEHERGRQ
jgi:hypothetical protein